MVFHPRGLKILPSSNSTDPSALNSLVEEITAAVRECLITQGVPLPKKSSHHPQKQGIPESDQIGDSSTLAGRIDHTLLKPDATHAEIQHVCEEARKYHFATVCVNATNVAIVAELLKDSTTKPIAVVDFPLGAGATAAKAFEAREAIRAGAREIDMVINIGALKSKDYTLVLEDIRAVVEASRPYGVKVILETSSLNEDEKIIGCALSKAAGAAFVKTSTGFAAGGATVADVQLMRRVVGPEMGVKASGGIRTLEDANKMIAAGATRLGASASVAIVNADSGTTHPEEY